MKGLGLLGLKVEDKVTGFTGVVGSISFDLYGCIQDLVNPGMGTDGKLRDQCWFDISRLNVLDETPVMKVPNFNDEPHGPEDKPVFGMRSN